MPKTESIYRLTRRRIDKLLDGRRTSPDAFGGDERRRQPRWPFPGTAELWPAGADGPPQWFATCLNLSEGGMGLRCDEPFEPGTPLDIAFHLPEASFFGRVTVRHCVETPKEDYHLGVQFAFET